ncbi:MAG: DUF6580 family putative transport protein [Terrimicrobiaceae bacterium]
MKIQNNNNQAVAALLVAGLIVVAAVYRVVSATSFPDLPNFSPVMAMAFCGAFFLPAVWAFFVPLAAVLISDIALAMMIGYPALSVGAATGWFCVAVAVVTGRWLATRGNRGALPLLTGLLANSVFFYLATNAASWIGNPAYAKNAAGLVQALTVGLPGYPPTWMFFRNSLISDILFAGLILGVYVLATKFVPSKHDAAHPAFSTKA